MARNAPPRTDDARRGEATASELTRADLRSKRTLANAKGKDFHEETPQYKFIITFDCVNKVLSSCFYSTTKIFIIL